MGVVHHPGRRLRDTAHILALATCPYRSGMDAFNPLDAARCLWHHWQAGTALDHLPMPLQPTTRAQGHAVQACLPEASGRAVLGWKIAATSQAGQAHINVGGPLPGRLLSGQVLAAGTPVPASGNRMRVAEPEMAFRFGQALAPRASAYRMDEVMAAVDSLHPSIEIPNSRFADFTAAGEAQLIADNACAHHFILGPASTTDWRALDLSQHPVHATVTRPDGRTWQRSGSGAAVLGDPRLALTWLVNALSELGVSLQPGQFVTTGTCMAPLAIEPGDQVLADFGDLGQLSMHFGAA